MYLRELVASLRRRWPWLLAAVLITLLACAGTVSLVKPTYTQQASVVLVPPKGLDDPNANRYLALGNLAQATGVLIRAVNGDQTQGAVGVDPDVESYIVEGDFTSSAPILLVTATSKQPARTRALLDRVLSEVPRVLDGLQSRLNIERSSRIVAIELTHQKDVDTVQKTRVRAGIAVFGLLGALLVFGIGALDGLLLRRQQKRDDEQPEVDVTRPRAWSGEWPSVTGLDNGPQDGPGQSDEGLEGPGDGDDAEVRGGGSRDDDTRDEAPEPAPAAASRPRTPPGPRPRTAPRRPRVGSTGRTGADGSDDSDADDSSAGPETAAGWVRAGQSGSAGR